MLKASRGWMSSPTVKRVEVLAAAGIRIMYGYMLTRICTIHVQGARIMLVGIYTNHGNAKLC